MLKQDQTYTDNKDRQWTVLWADKDFAVIRLVGTSDWPICITQKTSSASSGQKYELKN